MREEDLVLARILALEKQEEKDAPFESTINPLKHFRVQDLTQKRNQFR